MPLNLSIVTPRGTVIDESVDDVVAPGTEGEFGVLPGHAPFLAAIREGVVRYQSGGRPHYLAVSTGFAEVAGDHVVLLARTVGGDREGGVGGGAGDRTPVPALAVGPRALPRPADGLREAPLEIPRGLEAVPSSR